MSDDELAELLRQRPDVAVPPPADFEVLANRLSSRHSVSRVAERVDTFVLEVLEALVVAPRDEQALAAFCRVEVADVQRAAAVALRLGLLWRDGEGRLNPVPGVGSQVGSYPLGLGRPFARLIPQLHSDEQQELVRSLGLEPDGSPGAALTAYFLDAERVRALVDSLEPDERRILDTLDQGTPVGAVDGYPQVVPLDEARSRVERLIARGLLVATSNDAVELPFEIGLALRDERPARDLHPRPPGLGGQDVGTSSVDAGGAAAALDALRLVEAVLDRWDATPPTLTRAGGLPVRELRAMAKELAIEQPVAALLIQVVVSALLAGRTPGADPAMVPTERYERWRDLPLADRWALIATAWVGMDALPGLAVNPDGTKAAALLTYEMVRPGASELRRDVLAALASAGPGVAPDPAAVPAWLSWRAPTRSTGSVAQVTEWTLAEAQFLGVTGRGALTSAGRALIDAFDAGAARAGDDQAARDYRERVAEAMAPALPEPIEHVLIQADLTAVAPGPLRPPVARELSLVADVESAGAATVYRFSDSSLRRAFDAGRTAVDLHQLIGQLARGPVPQGLTYLIDDIGRRHGRLRAGRAASYLRSDDTGLLAEVVANKRTASAGLVLIAPTVAISSHEPEEVLAALRSAGYAPAGDRRPKGAAGGASIELDGVARRRVPVAQPRQHAVGWAGTALPESHVAQTVAMLRRVAELRRTGGSRGPAEPPEGVDAAHSPEEITQLLRAAVGDGGKVWIAYVNNEGRSSRRTVHPTMVSGGFMLGLDDESGERRTFMISRIQEARPA